MKRIILIILGLCLFLAIIGGCSTTDKPATSSDKVSVVSTIFAPYDFVREIAGDKVELTMLLPPGSESHSYEPTPQDVIKIQNCDLFVYVGGDSDAWVHEMLESMDTSKMKIVPLMDCVQTVEEEIVEGMEDDLSNSHGDEEFELADVKDHSMRGFAGLPKEDWSPFYSDSSHSNAEIGEFVGGHEEEHELDEHVWTSPKNAKLIVKKISDVLCEADSANTETYKQKTTTYLAKLDELDAKFQAVVDSAARKTIIFGDRFPFRYFADAYGFTYFAAFPGCSTETEASAATVKFLIDKINAEKIPGVFHVELSNKKMANTISEATGAKVLLFHACHNVTKAEFESGVSYLDLMNQNVENLKEALK